MAKKKTTVLLEPETGVPVPVVTDGTIGVEYTPPPGYTCALTVRARSN